MKVTVKGLLITVILIAFLVGTLYLSIAVNHAHDRAVIEQAKRELREER
jgi:hypothetical protein